MTARTTDIDEANEQIASLMEAQRLLRRRCAEADAAADAAVRNLADCDAELGVWKRRARAMAGIARGQRYVAEEAIQRLRDLEDVNSRLTAERDLLRRQRKLGVRILEKAGRRLVELRRRAWEGAS